MFRGLARAVIRGKWLVIAAWLGLAAGMYFFAPSLAQVGMSSDVAFLPQDAPSSQAQQVLVANFPQLAEASDGLLVVNDPGGLTDADRQYVGQLQTWLHSSEAPPQIGSITSPLDKPELASVLVSKDSTTMMVRIDFTSENYSDATNHAVELIRQHISQTRPAGLTVELTGQAAIGRDLLDTILNAVSQTTLITVLLVVLVLLVIYRSPIAAAVPLVTIGIAFLITRGALGLLVQGGMKVSSMVEAFIVVLIFGAGTDYALFLISRYREELAARRDATEAAIETVARIGPVITASGSTVIIATLGLIVARFEMTRTQGPAMALGIAIALLASLTLTPALLSVFGKHLFWPFHNKRVGEGAGESASVVRPSRFWSRVADRITTRPWITITIVSALLLLPFIALAQFTRSFNVLSELPAKVEARHAFDLLTEHFEQGEMLPVTVALTSTANLQSPAGLAHIAQVQADLANLAGVDRVRSIVDPTAGQDPAGARALLASEQVLGISRQIRQSFGAQAITGTTATTTSTTTISPMAQLDFIGTYLDDLGAAYPQAGGSSAYSDAKSALATLRARLGESLQALQVSYQLSSMSSKVEKLAGSMDTTTPTPSPQQGTGTTNAEQQLRSIYAYLIELAQAYPEVKGDPGYNQAVQALVLMIQLQKPEQRPALKQAMNDLVSGLRTLNARFQGRDAPFTPTSIRTQEPGSTGSGSAQDRQAALRQAATRLASALDGVAAALPQDAYFLPDSLAKEQPALGTLLGTFLSPDRTVTQVHVLLASNPYSEAAIKAVDAIKATAAGDTSEWEMTAYVGGPTVQVRDIHQMVSEDLPRVMILVVSGVFLVFVLLLGSLVAPIYLVGTVLLSYGTTMGLSTILFQGILGQEGINYVIPTIILVLLVALGADYNIFLISRVWEESSKEGSVRDGVRRASSFTGGVITSAGIILAGTFASLIVAPLQTLSQVGAAVALGVLVDTFIVRALLVPAIAAQVGRWNWWPARRPIGSGGAFRALIEAGRGIRARPRHSKPTRHTRHTPPAASGQSK